MDRLRPYQRFLPILLAVLAVIACGIGAVVGAGVAFTAWLDAGVASASAASTMPPTYAWPTETATPTATSAPTATQVPPTVTPSPTDTPVPTSTPVPSPSATEPVAVATLAPTSRAAAAAVAPTPLVTAAPSYAFVLAESDAFPTGKGDLDVFVAITDRNNNPVGDYHLLVTNASGQSLESATSVDRWSENSGANHYKAGNIKLHYENVVAGDWTLTLMDAANQVVAEPFVLAFEPAAPQWFFILFRLADNGA